MISEVAAAGRYTGNGVTASFVYPFKITDQTHLAVYVDELLKVLGTHYSVSGVGSATGSVTFGAGHIPASGAAVTILRDQPLEQASDYVLNEGFPSARVEQDLDKLAMQVQMLDERIKRALKFLPKSTLTDIGFPEPEAGKYLRATLTGFELVELTDSAVVDLVAGDVKALSDYASFAAAVTAIGATVTTLYVNQAATISTAMTTPTTLHIVVIGSGSFTKSGSGTITFSGPFEAPLNRQVFSGFSAGDVVFGPGSVDRLYAEWWGAKADASTDSTTPFTNTINVSKASLNVPIRAQSGQYKITGEVVIPQGILIECAGSGGSTQQYGTTFVHHSNGNLFVWDGSGSANAGTGGGLKNCLVLKADTYSGGDAVRLLATDDDHRPGEIFFENIIIYGIGTGLWARGLNTDGTASTTAGSKGVRSVSLNKFRVADCTINNEYIVINQGVHITGNHVQIDTADGTGTCGLTIKGDSENVNLSNLIINGNLIVADNATHVNLSGRVSALNVTGTSVIGTANLSTTSQILNASKTFKIAASNQKPAFLGVRTTAAANVTGDNTNYTVLYDSETFDKNSDFNPATGKFTANVAGIYKFQAAVLFADLASGHIRADVALNHKDSGGSTVGSYAAILNPYAISASGNAAVPISVEVEMSKGDTMEFVVNVSGSTKVVDVYGTAATIYTYFGGALL